MIKEEIVNVLTGEKTIIKYTAKELAELKKQQAAAKAELDAELLAAEQKRAERKAVLEKLGLSEEEVNLLLR